ncbi:unnamed protein product [Spodoptera littoralis]|uniref:Uncharacterized protein n=1 Tax=Spodoptera littoralis TaxID=7109 RepID=A0A9P0IEC5_SPOLI|nr:unnamed protein product [Spodoptera littoralis]CAH1646034.1 unnamed protein product [Spodoptera littoralis]
MNRKCILTIFTIILIVSSEGRKTSGRSRGSGSGRGTSRRTNYNPQPAPTSFSQAQAQKPTLFGWQERPGQSSWQSKSSSGQSHSYPSSGTGSHTYSSGGSGSHTYPSGGSGSHSYPSGTGLSGDNKPKASGGSGSHSYPSGGSGSHSYPSGGSGSHSYPSGTGLSGDNKPKQPSSPNQQAGHSYPSSPGSSGSAGGGYPQQTGSKYPQQGTGTGQTGYPQSAHNYPQQQHGVGGSGSAVAPPPYTPYQNNYGNQYHPQGPPPPYSNYGGSNYGGAGGHGYYNPGFGPQVPGYFGNYGKPSGGMSRGGSALAGVGIAGAGIGTVLTGLALWNLARSTGHHHHTVVYDNRGQPVAVAPVNDTSAAADSILADLVNCSLAISNDDKTEVLAIPCSIATSFTPDANVKDSDVNKDPNDNTKCTIAVLTKDGKEYMTTIPCSILLNTAAENNVTEPPLVVDQPINNNNFTSDGDIQNGTATENLPKGEPTALRLSGEDVNGDDKIFAQLNCTVQPEEIRDPINPCFSINHNLTVIPLPTTEAPK